MRIGIPRTLWYFTYGPFWNTYFAGIGAEVVPSRPTTRPIMDAGIKACVSEACLPIKVYFGHVIDLIGRVDYLFVPRLMSLRGTRVFCPKFLGLPDLIRHSGLKLPELLTPRIDHRATPFALWRACRELGKTLGIRWQKNVAAYLAASRAQRRHRVSLAAGTLPEGARPLPGARGRAASGATAKRSLEKPDAPPLQVALLGYPYLVFDEYVNLGLLEKMQRLGLRFRTIETVPESAMRAQNRRFPKRPFWQYSDQVARSGYHFLGPGRGEVAGVIHLTAFACGPDAMVDKLLEMEATRQRRPYLNITLDEQSGEAGYVTRLEAFVDMLRRREEGARG